jgi:ankyrin repeat protein
VTREQAERIVIDHGLEPDEHATLVSAVVDAAKNGRTELLQALLVLGAPAAGKRAAGKPPIVAAAEAGSVERIEALLASGADIEEVDGEGDTALATAVGWNRADAVAALSARGGKLETANRAGITPLVRATMKGSEAIVKLLLSLGADPNSSVAGGSSPLWFAQQTPRILQMLLEAGANPNIINESGTPLLNIAATRGNAEVMDLLLRHGADLRAGPFGWTAWMMAAARSHGSACEALEAHGAHRCDMRGTELHRAAEKNDVASVQRLLDAGVPVDVLDSTGASPLMSAFAADALDVTESLLARGASPKIANRDGYSPLSIAARSGRLDWVDRLLALGASPDAGGRSRALLAAARDGHVEIVRRLAPITTDLDGTDDVGQTAVFLAAASGHAAIVDLLAQRGANLEIDCKGTRAVHIAVQKRSNVTIPVEKKIDVLRMLVRHGADLNARDGLGATPLLRIAGVRAGNDPDGPAIAKALLELGADATLTDPITGNTAYESAKSDQRGVADAIFDVLTEVPPERVGPAHLLCYVDLDLDTMTALFEGGMSADVCSAGVHPPFIAAARLETPEIAMEMLAHGADPNTSDESYGITTSVLGAAAKRGHTGLVEALLARGADVNRGDPLRQAAGANQLDVVNVLLGAGAKVTPRRGGWTPLHAAAQAGSQDICRLLLERGANPNVRNQVLKTPLDLAREAHNNACVKLLAPVTRVDRADAEGATPLYAAVIAGNVEQVRDLLAAGADPDLAAKGGETARQAARLRAGTAALLGVEHRPHVPVRHERDPDAFHALYRGEPLAAKPDVRLTNARGDTLLHCAVIQGRIEAATTLLAAEADPKRPNRVGETPWSLAIVYQSSAPDLEKAIREAGGKIDLPKQIQTYSHEQALAAALLRGDIRAIDRLIEEGVAPLHIGWGGGPLRQAVLAGDDDLVVMLIGKGVDVTVKVDGQAAADLALGTGAWRILGLLLDAGGTVLRPLAEIAEREAADPAFRVPDDLRARVGLAPHA